MNPSSESHQEIPGPTIWPAVLSVGVTVFGMGLITSGVFIVVGLALFALGLGAWIGELRHE